MQGATKRLRVLSLLVIVTALILVANLYLVQVIRGANFRDRAEHQYVAGANYFDRGAIYFSTKDGTPVPAATVTDGFILAVNPGIISQELNLDAIYQELNAVVPLGYDEFFAKSTKEGDTYEELAKRLDEDTAAKIRALKIPGVSLFRERWRTYPGGSMAAHAVGLIGYKGDVLAGRYGLEREYDAVLERNTDNTFTNFFAEIFTNIKRTVQTGSSFEGDVVTTIEPSVQAFLQDEVDKVNSRYASDFTGGIVINPNTGEIYAMALTPTFNPGRLDEVSNVAVFSNKLVEDRYEMGSIIKAITIASGLDAGAITAKTTYNDPGCMTLNTKTFCNYDQLSHGTNLSMQQVLNQSLNTGAAFAALKIGNTKFTDYLLKFGLDSKTGIDLPAEGDSLVSNLKNNRDLEHAQASFGQGIALTPIATVRALSALANGGTLITPHLAKEIRYEIGTYKSIDYPDKDHQPRVLKQESSEEISRMLTNVVDYSLRNGALRLQNYSVAAKTGTAQIANPGGGGYYSDRYLHSFFGYFPSYDPQFLVFLYTYYPKGVQYASETLTDSFINTVKFLINYYNVAPDREAPPPAAI